MASVLIAETSVRTREALRQALSKEFSRVDAVSNADDAVAAASASAPDWVVLDADLPGMPTGACIRLLRSAAGGRHRKFLLLCATATREHVAELIGAGASDLVLRSPELVRNVVQRLGGRREVAEPRAGSSAERRHSPTPECIAGAREAELDDGVAFPDWRQSIKELRHIQPVSSRAEMMAQLDQAAELRALSPVVRNIVALTANPSTSTEQLARVVKQDHAVSIRLLKLANSSIYARGMPVDSVAKAVSRIGMAQIRETVLGMAVIDQFSNLAGCEQIRGEWFWEHSIACGLIAARLARACGIGEELADSLFTAGLLHDIGRVLMAETLGATYAGVLARADDLGLPVDVIESRVLSITHADLTDRILRQWGLPAELVNPISLHHLSIGNARRLAPQMIDSVAIVALANRLAHALLLGSSGNEVISPIGEHIQALRLPTTVLAHIVDEIPGEAADMRLALLSRTSGPVTTLAADHTRQQIGQRIHARGVAIDGPADALSIAASTLSDESCEPNLAIVAIHAQRDAAELSRLLAQADAEAGRKLPAIIASPTASLELDRSVMAGRSTRLLPTSMPLARLVDAARGLLEGSDKDTTARSRAAA